MKRRIFIGILIVVIIIGIIVSIIGVNNYKDYYGLTLDSKTETAICSYINSKYHFTPKIEGTLKIRQEGIFGSGGAIENRKTESRFVKANYGGRVFFVFYNKYKNKFYDSYQEEDIKNFYKSYFKSLVGEVPDNIYIADEACEGYSVFKINNLNPYTLLINEYVDITNKTTTLKEAARGTYIEYFKPVDLTSIKKEDLENKNSLNSSIKVTSYKRDISNDLLWTQRFTGYYDNRNEYDKYSYASYNEYSDYFECGKFDQ